MFLVALRLVEPAIAINYSILLAREVDGEALSSRYLAFEPDGLLSLRASIKIMSR